MRALVFERNELRYAAAHVASRLSPGAGAGVGPLRLIDVDEPELPAESWEVVRPRLSGICGSDLATVEGRASRYFDPLVSFPFVPGHEVVGELEDGRRVALEPTLGPHARGLEEQPNDYGYLLGGELEAGIQIGYCASTGGGWGSQLVAHPSQLHTVDDAITDEVAVMVEPTAVGVHTVCRGQVGAGDLVVILGAGTMGLCTLAALRRLAPDATVVTAAKYPHQRELAAELGSDHVVSPDEVVRAVRRITGSRMLGDDLSGGADVTLDAVGSPATLATAISLTRPRGRVVLAGMPGMGARVDLTSLWHRETELVGAYTYGIDELPDGTVRATFDVAREVAMAADLGRLVSARYPIDRYRDAIRHAAEAGPRGAIKVVFDLRS